MCSMAVLSNYLIQVQTFQESNLAIMQNSYCAIDTFNSMYNEFNKIDTNLGATVTYDKPPRFVTQRSLDVTFQGANQRLQPLTVDQQANVSYVFTSQQIIFNVKNYLSKFGKSAIGQLGSTVERDILELCETAPY